MSNLSTIQERANQFRNTLANPKVRDQIALALPEHIKPDHMLRVVMTTIQRNPGILNCTEHSVLAAVMQASQLGLEPDSNLGLCYLVPYGSQCQLIVGYKGYIELARRSGMLSNVRAHVVQAGDVFEYELGLEPKLRHIPMDMLEAEQEALRQKALKALGGAAETIVAAYAVVNLKDKSQMFEVVTRSFVNRIKRMSKSSDRPDSPWKQWEDQMWKKTALRQVFKYVPLSPEDQLRVALERDEKPFVGFAGKELLVLEEDPALNSTPQLNEPVGDTTAAPATAMDNFAQQQAAAIPKRRGRRPAAQSAPTADAPSAPATATTAPASSEQAPAPPAQTPVPVAPPPPPGPAAPGESTTNPRQIHMFGDGNAPSPTKEDPELEGV